MTHPETEQLLAHVDGELSNHEANAIVGHIAGCAECARSVAELRDTSRLFGIALGGIDRMEPAGWGGAATADVIPMLPRVRRPPRPLRGGRVLRRAALFLLASTAVASAAVLIDRAIEAEPDSVSGPGATQSVNGAVTAVSVVPVGGVVEVALAGVADGTRVRVVVEDRVDVRVMVEGAAAPHFTAAAGHLAVQLSGEAVHVSVVVPRQLVSGRVTVAGKVVVNIDAGSVTPAAALGEGVLIGSGPSRNE